MQGGRTAGSSAAAERRSAVGEMCGTGIMVAGFQFRGNIPAEEVSTEIRGHFTRNLPGILNFPECNDGIHGVHGLELSMLFCS